MALTKLTKDMDIIQKLGDEPNDVDGLSAAELKAKFDEGNNAMKQWVNETFIPEVEKEIKASRLENLPKHAHTHAKDGRDPVTPADIGFEHSAQQIDNLVNKFIDWFGKGTAISTGDDLSADKYKVPGKYYAQTGTLVKSLVNRPEGLVDNFSMYVFQRTGSAGAVNQLILTIHGGIFMRGSSEDGALGEWAEVLSSEAGEALIAAITAESIGAIPAASKPSGTYTGNGSATTRTIDTGVVSSLNNAALIRRSGGKSFAIVAPSGFIGKDENDTVVAGTGASFGGVSGKITLMSIDLMFNANGEEYRWYCL